MILDSVPSARSREAAMATSERKSLVWAIRKSLLTLPADELFQISKALVLVPGMDQSCPSHLTAEDEEGCFSYINDYMCSKTLLDLEDAGLGYLLQIKDVVDEIVGSKEGVKEVVSQVTISNSQSDDVNVEVDHGVKDVEVVENVTTQDATLQKMLSSYEELSKQIAQYLPSHTPQHVAKPQPHVQSMPLDKSATDTRGKREHPTHVTPDKLVSLRDLSYLHRREFKIQGGQIGDPGSDISYNSVCRQIEEGLKEQFSDAEVVRAVLRVIKPGNFKDMLMVKDDLSVDELKGFLHSHLGEQSNTELFQELMCTKQKDSETPQQFLYRVIGLKQKILLASKHTDTDVKYNASTVQDVFLHTVYQGLGHKHDDIRRELKPLLVDASVPDEVILKQMKKVMSDESERQRRLGPVSRQKSTNVHSAEAEVAAAQASPNVKEESSGKKPKTDMIQQLTEKVEKLTSLVELMQQQTQDRTGKPDRKRDRPFGCDKCVEQNLPKCPHCFYCGEEGHRSVGCLKKPPRQGNWSRSLQGDKH